LSAFHEAHFDLDFAHREITGIGVNLALQWLEYEGLVAICVRELCGFSISEREQRGDKDRPKLSDLTGLKLDRDLGWVGAAVEDREGDLLICLVEFVS
jgi:hypothetical protein